MTEFTRRRFLRKTSLISVAGVGIAATGAALVLPRGAPVAARPSAATSSPPATLPSAPALTGDSFTGPMLVHVRDLATAEIGVMVGTRELVYHDPELVTRLVTTANQAAKAAG